MTTFVLIVLSRTPVWVWGVLAGLIVLGLLQARHHTVSRRRLVALPLAMSALSLVSATGAFGARPAVLLAWALGIAAGLAANRRLGLPHQVQALADGRWAIGGSLVPLGLLMAIFWMRYGVAATLAVVPALATQPVFAAVCSALYGAATGLLAARALRVLGHRAPTALAAAAA